MHNINLIDVYYWHCRPYYVGSRYRKTSCGASAWLRPVSIDNVGEGYIVEWCSHDSGLL